MKILITNVHLSIPHGSQVFTAVIAQELTRRGHDVYLFSPEMGEFHFHMLKDIPAISNSGNWSKDDNDIDEPFDIAILQHLNHIGNNPIWLKAVKPMLPPSDKIIVICHGTVPSPERPIPRTEFLENAHYVCISEEIAEHYSDFPWTIIKQPIDPAWFDITTKPVVKKPERIVWASHRHQMPEPFTQFCIDNQIGIYAAGKKLQYPHEIREIYSQVDLVVGTGRWIYEGLAAGIPCIVADVNRDLGFVTVENVMDYEKFNMTLRHPKVLPSSWEILFDNYITSQVKSLKIYAKQNYHVSKVVDRLMRILGIDSVGEIINKVFS